MAQAVATHGFGAAPLLGGRAHRLSTAGKIRAGIKILTEAAAAIPVARAIYDKGMAANLSYAEIEAQITAAVPGLTEPLEPHNVQYFSVRPSDFPNPEVARQILAKFGEDRGEGLKLYRFPVLFASDTWQTVMPHELAMWEDGMKKFWSVYSDDGRSRSCMAFESAEHAGDKRVIRVFGGRKHVLRADNNGVCDPDRCEEYQAGHCKLSGRLIFCIPGIKSVAPLEIQTSSYIAMRGAVDTFEAVASVRGGRISGFLDGRRTPFYVTKALAPMRRMDANGQIVRDRQWVIELEAPVDVGELLHLEADDRGALARADLAARMLSVPVVHRPPAAAECFKAPPTFGRSPDDPSLTAITDLLVGLGADPVQYQLYADSRYGAGWKLNPNGRRQVLAEIEGYRADPRRLNALIAHAV